MVYETPDQMSAVKKLSLRRGIKSPFGRKSSKKPAKLTPTEYLFVDDDSAAVASPTNDADVCQRKDINEPEMDITSRSVIAKGPSGKAYKWPFRNKRSEDNRNVKTEPKTSLPDDHDNGKPGSNLENNRYLKGTGDCTDARAWGKQGIGSPDETGDKHQFLRRGKGEGYVVPLRRQQDKPMGNTASDNLSEHLQEVNLKGCLDGSNCKEMQDESDGSSRDMNGNPSCSPPSTDNTQVIPNEETDISPQITTDRFLAPQLPPPLQEPELPPRIPPKPASLRNRPFRSPDPFTSYNGMSEELDDGDKPPRPPARPKNRTLGKGSLILWNNLRDNPHDNRATVYETISLEPKEASLATELVKLPRQPWYWGPLTQAQAEDKLAKLPDGNFLVRDSSDERYLLSLSFNSHGRTLHTRIEHRNGLFSLNDSDGHISVVELIECAVKESRSGVYGYMRDALGVQSFPARLTDWVSRFTEMRSLQHLCRFLIREVYPRHHIQMLPLPKKIKEYILENQY